MKTGSAKDTKALGEKIARKLKGGEVLILIGDLGSGKTTFVKGLARGLGVKNNITSPTFVLFKVYRTTKGNIKQLAHADCYRVPGKEFYKIGLGEYMNNPNTVTVVEWGEKLPKPPKNSINITFQLGKNDSERMIIIK